MARSFESNPLQQRRLVGGITIPETRAARAELVDDLSLESAVRNIFACAGGELQIAFRRDERRNATAETRLGHKCGHKMGWSPGFVLRTLLVKFKRS